MKTQKPILRHQRPQVRINKPFVKRNDALPGYVYIFHDSVVGLCKIGLSRSPLKRKYYLEKTYGKLTTIAIVWTVNMAWVERMLHQKYKLKRERRLPGQDGFTEWFRVNALEARMSLYMTAFFVNGIYAIAGLLAIGFLGLIASIF